LGNVTVDEATVICTFVAEDVTVKKLYVEPVMKLLVPSTVTTALLSAPTTEMPVWETKTSLPPVIVRVRALMEAEEYTISPEGAVHVAPLDVILALVTVLTKRMHWVDGELTEDPPVTSTVYSPGGLP
jgi:hypothetical protein